MQFPKWGYDPRPARAFYLRLPKTIQLVTSVMML